VRRLARARHKPMNIERKFGARMRALLAPLLVLAALLAWSGSAAAQRRGEPQVRAYLSSGVLRLGERAQLIVTVENANSAELRSLPKVDGLTIGPAPNANDVMQQLAVGGRVETTLSRTWLIPVAPTKAGEFTLAPFELLVNGSTVRTPELRLRVVADLKGEELGFFEIRASSPKVVVGQPFSVVLEFGFDASIQERINYGNLALSWWGRLPGLLENETPPDPAARSIELYLNDRERVNVLAVEPLREMRGRRFVTLRVVRSYTPTRTGKIEFPLSFFEFGEVVERRDFFRTERQKGETFFARAPEFSIEVVPLPEAGKPVDFTGAIGALAVSASAQPRDVDAGESIKLRVEWTGAGNLEFFTAPDPSRLESFRDFRVYGKTEEKSFDRRVVVYDLAPLSSSVKAIPALPLAVFEPQSERYTSVSTAPIEIRVRALEGASGLAGDEVRERFDEDLVDIVARPDAAQERSPLGAGWVLALTGAVPLGWIALRTAARRHGAPDAPRERARRRARRALGKELAKVREPREQLSALHRFLAARTDRSPEDWEGRNVREALAPSQAERARELEACVAELESAVWGGRGGALKRERLEAAVDEALKGGL